jgi:hypothetical protein
MKQPYFYNNKKMGIKHKDSLFTINLSKISKYIIIYIMGFKILTLKIFNSK